MHDYLSFRLISDRFVQNFNQAEKVILLFDTVGIIIFSLIRNFCKKLHH